MSYIGFKSIKNYITDERINKVPFSTNKLLDTIADKKISKEKLNNVKKYIDVSKLKKDPNEYLDARAMHKKAKEERLKNQQLKPITKSEQSKKMIQKLIGAVQLNKMKNSELVNLLLKNGADEEFNKMKKSELINLLLDNDLYIFLYWHLKDKTVNVFQSLRNQKIGPQFTNHGNIN